MRPCYVCGEAMAYLYATDGAVYLACPACYERRFLDDVYDCIARQQDATRDAVIAAGRRTDGEKGGRT